MKGFVLVLDLYSVKCNPIPRKQYINAEIEEKLS